MAWFDSFKSLKSSEVRLAWLVAVSVDALQIAFLPLFVEGALSPADTLLDLTAAAILIRLLGWHWAFLPSLLAELVPGLDLFPTWTAAVFYVTRSLQPSGDDAKTWTGQNSPEPEILPPGPAPARRG